MRQRAKPAPAAEPAPVVRIADLLSRQAGALRLQLCAGRSGLQNEIAYSRIQRPGLALTGYTDYISYGRVQILGRSELGYLKTLAPARARQKLRLLCDRRISCFVITRGQAPPRELARAAGARGIPVLATPSASTPFIKELSAFLEQRLAPRLHLHAVLVDVFGLGVMITGESGIGKSECALDLIDRGHRLVADDVVDIRRMGDAAIGSSPPLTRYHMELRGLGVINIRDLYGVSSLRASKRIELVVILERWDGGKEYDRLGLRRERYPVLGVSVPVIRLPVAPGRDTAILVEVAARNQLLKEGGYDAARRFARRVDKVIGARPPAQPAPGPRKARRGAA